MVDPAIHITRAGIEDADLISHLSKKTFEDTFRGTCKDDELQTFVDTSFSADVTLEELKDESDLYFIAWDDTNPAGYMRLKENYTEYPAIQKYKALELKRIYALESYHGKKVGATLMEFALQLAKEKNYEAVWLGVWEYNERAKAFYKKWGFVDTGDSHYFPIGNTPQTDNWMIKHLV